MEWLKEGERYLVGDVLNDFSLKVLDFVDILPVDILPKIIRSHNVDELKRYHQFYESHSRLSGEIKVNKTGLRQKLKSNFSRYPLLISYIEHSNDSMEIKKETIKEYVNQVNK